MHDAFTSAASARRGGVAQGHRWLFGMVRPKDDRYDRAQVPSGFLVGQQNAGRYHEREVLPAAAVAAMQAPGCRQVRQASVTVSAGSRPRSRLGLRGSYLVVDVVLAGLLLLALIPWLWVVCLVVMLAGVLRLMAVLRSPRPG